MILGIGTDILKIRRIRNLGVNPSDSFILKTYTAKEREEAASRSDAALYFATRFAGKEAVSKCLGREGTGVVPSEIEILGSSTGQPFVTLSGTAKAISDDEGVKQVHISLSYDDEYAIAYAIAER